MSTSAAAGRRLDRRSGSCSKNAGGSCQAGVAAPDSAAVIAVHTRSGVQGMSMWRTPRWLTASTTAFCTAGVEPMAHTQDVMIPLRDDVVTERDNRVLFQRAAPAVAAGLYLVPRVIE